MFLLQFLKTCAELKVPDDLTEHEIDNLTSPSTVPEARIVTKFSYL